MPQFQYQPVAFPPEQTPPVTAALGWDRTNDPPPQAFINRREYLTRGGGYRAFHDTQSHAVFAVEKWATPLGWGTEFPDRPHLTINRRDLRLRGGGYRALYDTQSHAVFAVEKWATPLGWGTEFPDRPHLSINRRDFRLRGGGYRSLYDAVQVRPDPVVAGVTPFFLAELPDDPRMGRRRQLNIATMYESDFGTDVAVPAMSWTGSWPDNPIKGRVLGADKQQALFRVDVQAQQAIGWWAEYPDSTYERVFGVSGLSFSFRAEETTAVSPLSWSAEYSDTTRRLSLKTHTLPSSFRGEAPEQFAPTLLWSVSYPDRVPLLRPQTRIEGLSFALQDLAIVVPALSWRGEYPSRTMRTSLGVPDIPSLFKGETLEQFAPTLLWSATYQDRVPILRPQTRIDGFNFALQDLTIVVPALSWNGSYPDRTLRNVLKASAVPSVFRGEAVEQLTRLLLAYVIAPDTTRRLALPTFGHPAQARMDVPALQSYVPATYTDTTRRAVLPMAFRPSLQQTLDVENLARTLLATVTYPDTTRRLSLRPSAIPSQFKGESVENFARTLLASVTYPDTTRRDALWPGNFSSFLNYVRVTPITLTPIRARGSYAPLILATASGPENRIITSNASYAPLINGAGSLTIAPETYEDAVFQLNPLAYWSLDGANSVALDSSGNDNHGALIGAITTQQPGFVVGGHSYLFDNHAPFSAKITVPANLPLASIGNRTTISIAAWLNVLTSEPFADPSKILLALSNTVNPATDALYVGGYWDSIGQFTIFAVIPLFFLPPLSNNGGIAVSSGVFSSFPTGKVFMTVTFDGDHMKMYINGVLQDDQSVGGLACVIDSIMDGSLLIGNTFDPTGVGWNGLVANLAIFTSVLTLDQIAHLYSFRIGV